MPDELLTFFRWSLTCTDVHSVLKFAASAAVHNSAIRCMYQYTHNPGKLGDNLHHYFNQIILCGIRQQQQHISHYTRALFCARLFYAFLL